MRVPSVGRLGLRAVCVAASCWGVVGCGSSDSNPIIFGGSGANAGGAAQGGSSASSGAGGTGNSAGSVSGGAGGGGASAGASTGGGSGAAGGGSSGASGSGGSGGGLPAGCVEAGTPGKTGRQCDPGKDGNGTSNQTDPGNNDTPPEGVGTAKGMVLASETYASKIYGYNFTYQVFVPVQYVAGTPACLMIFQDGGNYLVNFHTPKVFETLIDAKAMPVTIAVFINPGNDRSKEYDSIDDKYVRFLTEELIPERIAPKFALVDDPNGWAIGGHSSGGSAAFSAGWQKPGKFRKILTNSGSFVNLQGNTSAGTYPTIVASVTPPKPLRISMSSGTTDLGGWRDANDKMAAALEAAGYPYHYVKNGGSHDPRPWGTADYANVMRWLWRGYSLPPY